MPDELSSGQVMGRRTEPRDVDLLTRWTTAYDIEALGAEQDQQLEEDSRKSVERSLKEGRTWVLASRGEPVACSSFNTAIKEAVQVGGVWTPPELRRRGYGRAVVAASLLDARAKGVEKAILFTGESNLAAQRAYTALGFRHVGDYRLVLLREAIEMHGRGARFAATSAAIRAASEPEVPRANIPDAELTALVEKARKAKV